MSKKNKSTSGFVYLWFDKKRKMYYVGCHWGYEDDGYICSSNRMRDAYYRRPKDFKRRILSVIYTNRKELIDKEFSWLSLIKEEELSIRYYNKTNYRNGHWIEDPETKKVVSFKVSESNKGKPGPNKGRKFSEESRRKMSDSAKKRKNEVWNKGKSGYHIHSEESRKAISEKNKGQKRSEEFRKNLIGHEVSEATREKLRIANLGKGSPLKGIPLSEEHKQKLSAAKMGHEVSQATRDKLSEMFTGRKGPNLGRKFSTEVRRNMSEAAKKKKGEPWNKGIKTGPQSEETCQKKRLAKIDFIPQNSGLKTQNLSAAL